MFGLRYCTTFFATLVFSTQLLVDVVYGYSLLNGVMVTPVVKDGNIVSGNSNMKPIDLGESMQQRNGKTMIVFGTYAADFNAIEYGQRLRYYYPLLQEKGVSKCALILNCHENAAMKYKEYLDLPNSIDVYIDPTGYAGRTFGVSRGWIPDNMNIHPYIKLFGMLLGLGAYATLPAVISGYIGNPFTKQPWITDALIVGNTQQRWPMNAIEIIRDNDNDNDGSIVSVINKFDELPIVGTTWGRRPLELATLRLQNMMGISIAHWDELCPTSKAILDDGILTQLGGCLVIDHNKNNQILYDWKDPGICAVANFEDILKVI